MLLPLLRCYHLPLVCLLAVQNPVLKFATIKAVVFFTFWQGLLIHALAKARAIDAERMRGLIIWTNAEVAEGKVR